MAADRPVEDDDWQVSWQPMLDAVGRDFSADHPTIWGEVIDRTAISRFLEPLELECALHWDDAAARARGHPSIVVPVSALTSMAVPLWWRPGDPPLFSSDERDAKADRSPLTVGLCGIEPPTTHIFAVRWDMDFLRPAYLGDRLGRCGLKLVSCKPKQLRVGRGAFIELESKIINQDEETVVLVRNTVFRYNLHDQ